jgi:phosphate transport system substrate-binding protein
MGRGLQGRHRQPGELPGIGSSGGVKQIKAKTVDFGGTDAPVKEADLDAAGLTQFPTVMGGVTIVVNLPGVASGQVKLDGPTTAEKIGRAHV